MVAPLVASLIVTVTDPVKVPPPGLNAGVAAVVEIPLLFSRTEIVRAWRFATARSGAPSPLKSLTATNTGSLSTARLWPAWNVPSPLPNSTAIVGLPSSLLTTRSCLPSPLPSSTEIVLTFKSQTARSSLPSPLKSPTATPAGPLPTVKLDPGRKVPSPLPNSTVTVLEGELLQSREQP